ncbi:MAG TPA: DivIVA domain-containing protein [Candidatus Avimonas sp.]|mgnify:CR=1 FL=1|nr:DivIVA domain-containing protein [Clostridiales bacterium]HPU58141.1 DivIVA domain-containing protein [Candidatus Avimonas sp.]
MLTANDIRNVRFSTSMGGYRKYEVDEFLEKCAETVAELTASKSELEKKLEILADKLVEYRNDEDNIRTALLSAQKLGDTVVREAKHKAERILEDAQNKAEKILENAKKSIQDEERELERIKREVTNFKSRLLSIYKEHLSLIDILPEVKDEEPEQKPEDAEQQPEVKAEPVAENQNAEPVAETAKASEAPAESNDTIEFKRPAPDIVLDIPEIDDAATPITVEPAATEPKPSSKFADLKFGDDYDISKDVSEENIGFFRRLK